MSFIYQSDTGLESTQISRTFASVAAYNSHSDFDYIGVPINNLLTYIETEGRLKTNTEEHEKILAAPKDYNIINYLTKNFCFTEESLLEGFLSEVEKYEVRLQELEEKMEKLEDNYRRILAEHKCRQDYFTYNEEGVMHGSITTRKSTSL